MLTFVISKYYLLNTICMLEQEHYMKIEIYRFLLSIFEAWHQNWQKLLEIRRRTTVNYRVFFKPPHWLKLTCFEHWKVTVKSISSTTSPSSSSIAIKQVERQWLVPTKRNPPSAENVTLMRKSETIFTYQRWCKLGPSVALCVPLCA